MDKRFIWIGNRYLAIDHISAIKLIPGDAWHVLAWINGISEPWEFFNDEAEAVLGWVEEWSVNVLIAHKEVTE